jgi:Na+-translocating ferredoxin:NAD+ oxidoreductase RnfD subunit
MNEEQKSPSLKYELIKPPHIHIGFEKNELMLKTFLMMSVIAGASVIILGIPALIHILIALGTVLVVYSVISSYQKLKGKPLTYESPASALVAGLIVGLAMPISGPYEITAAVALLMILIFKYGQGRYLSRKYLNPVVAAKVVLLVALSLMIFLENSLRLGLIFHPHHLELNLFTPEGFQDSMWIFEGEILPILGIELSALLSLFFWQTHGWVGGACGVLVLIVGSIAAYWLKFKWRIIVSTLTVLTLLAVGYGFLVGGDPLLRVAFHVFTGSSIFMVFFMATEPQSTPMPEISQYIFGIILGAMTFVLQLFNVLGGSIIALLILNIATPFFDKTIIRTPFGFKEKNKKSN